MTNRKKIALLGTGIMGSGMGMNLLAGGHDLKVWNRTVERTRNLVAKGATLASSPGAAVEGVEFVITMLADGEAVRAVLKGEQGALSGMNREQVWVEMSTVGLEDIEEFAAMAADRGVGFADAPVLGTKAPAEKGELVVLAGGDREVVERCRPIFDAIGRRTIVLGFGNVATRLKLILNNWVVSLVGVLAETISLSEALDVDPQLFIASIKGGPLDVGYAHVKGDSMMKRSFSPAFPLELALKDSRLILSAAQKHGLDPKILQAVANRLLEAKQQGYGKEDISAVFNAVKEAERPLVNQ